MGAKRSAIGFLAALPAFFAVGLAADDAAFGGLYRALARPLGRFEFWWGVVSLIYWGVVFLALILVASIADSNGSSAPGGGPSGSAASESPTTAEALLYLFAFWAVGSLIWFAYSVSIGVAAYVRSLPPSGLAILYGTTFGGPSAVAAMASLGEIRSWLGLRVWRRLGRRSRARRLQQPRPPSAGPEATGKAAGGPTAQGASGEGAPAEAGPGSARPQEKGYLRRYLEQEGHGRAYYLMKAAREAAALPEARSLLGHDDMARLSGVAREFEDLAYYEGASKDYGSYRRLLKGMGKDAGDLERRAAEVAQAAARAVLEACADVEGRARGLGVYVPSAVPCSGLYLDPYRPEAYYEAYPWVLANAIVDVSRMRRLLGTYEVYATSLVRHYAGDLGVDVGQVGNMEGALRAVNETVLGLDAIEYLSRVKADLGGLARRVLVLQLLTRPPPRPRPAEGRALKVYDDGELLADNVVAVATYAMERPNELLELVRARAPAGQADAEVAGLSVTEGSLRALRSTLAAALGIGGDTYLGDPLFLPLYFMSAGCGGCEQAARLVAAMPPAARAEVLEAIGEGRGLRAKRLAAPGGPGEALARLAGDPDVARYTTVSTGSATLPQALSNLRKYWYARQLMAGYAQSLASSLEAVARSPEFLQLFPGYGVALAADRLSRGAASRWRDLDGLVAAAIQEIDLAAGRGGVESAVEARLARLVRGGLEVPVHDPGYTFDELRSLGLIDVGARRAGEEAPFVVYETRHGSVYATRSAARFYASLRGRLAGLGGAALDSMAGEVAKAYGAPDEATARRLVELFANRLLGVGLLEAAR